MVNKDERLFERMSCDWRVEVYNPVQRKTDCARSYDFSGGGIGLVSKRPLPHADEVDLMITSAKRPRPVMCKGQIVWSAEQASGFWNIGVRFLGENLAKLRPLMKDARQ